MLETLKEIRRLFQAYVGAVVAQSGPNAACNWITQLIDPKAKIHSYSSGHQNGSEEYRASKRARSEYSPSESPAPPSPVVLPSPSTPGTYIPITGSALHGSAPQSTNASVSGAASTVIAPQPASNKSAPKPPGYLLAFNQKCAQMHLKVDYQAVNHASPHNPLWVTKCLGTLNHQLFMQKRSLKKRYSEWYRKERRTGSNQTSG